MSSQETPCGRVAHSSRAKAFKRIIALRKAGGPGTDGLEPYHCHRCNAWHVGRPRSYFEVKRNRGERLLYERPGGDA